MRTVSICVWVLITTFGCGRKTESTKPFSFEQQIGIAGLLSTQESCMAIANSSIQPDTRVMLADQGAEKLAFKESRVGEAIVVGRLETCDGNHLHSTELNPSGPTYYRIRTTGEWKGNGYAFVIVGPSGTVSVDKDQKVEGDLDGDGKVEFFRVCTSSEGGHYQVWTGEPLVGQPRWHWYVYAGYDTGVTCTEKEYFGPKER